MRRIKHWTPRYVLNRIRQEIYYLRSGMSPWFTAEAVALLTQLVRSDDIALEWGSGRSTIWLGQRVHQLTSVESNREWFERVSTWVKEKKLNNIKLVMAQLSSLAPSEVQDLDKFEPEYLSPAQRFHPESLDLVIVDGDCRAHSTLLSIPLLRPGGLLIIDNVNWFLPSDSISPTSRGVAEGPASSLWSSVANVLEPWRRIWTSNGVTDTAIFIKPFRRDLSEP